MRVQTRASAEILASPERVFDLVVDYRNCPDFFRSWGPIPGVAHAEAWADRGDGRARRTLKLSDGSTHQEEILVLERPRIYKYRWLNPPPAPLNFIVRTAEAHWTFQPIDAGAHTRIVFRYDFELTFPFAYPFALALRAMFNRWMVAALDRVQQASLDATHSPAP